MAMQFKTLAEIAELFQKALLNTKDWKQYINHVRPAAYSDLESFTSQRDVIEKAWPAYLYTAELCRPPKTIYTDGRAHFLSQAYSENSQDVTEAKLQWGVEGDIYREHYYKRLQFVQAHMNNHIHPLNASTGERVPLKSCRRKDRPQETKCGFPVDDGEMVAVARLVCTCYADVCNWSTEGPRSMVGSVLPVRNDTMLNAGPSAWLVWAGDNGDIKFPHKIPIIPETHDEPVALYNQKHSECVSAACTLNMLYDLQAAQSMAAGYFGGYTSKTQDIGQKELRQLREALERKVDREQRKPLPKSFQEYSKRLLKDLEARSTVRTAVENLNLAIHSDLAASLSA